MTRNDGRAPSQLRPCTIETDFVGSAYGSCLVSMGKTRVICTASVEESVPPFLRGQGKGWVTAEYAMLPASTGQRKARDGIKKDGRSVEIQRLIGRSLRQAVDMELLGERTVYLDCDVLEADGGTRTAAITGAFVALACAVSRLLTEGKLTLSPIITQVAAVSAGIVQHTPCLDLCYIEDSRAQVDMNAVMNSAGDFIELQGTGEGRAFTKCEWDILTGYAGEGIRRLMSIQREALGARSACILPRDTLVAATGNPHKLKELKSLLNGHFRLISMKEAGFTDEIEENGDTFAQNALIKAEAITRATGLCAIADDSGLSVDALGGAPGVHSARYAGTHGDDTANNMLLLQNLQGAESRSARFVCAMALTRPGREPLITQGECPGEILRAPRGNSGFGYDPLFLYESGQTFAQMPDEEKNKVSHRYQAAIAMLTLMEKEN